jgi:hypothetical protein
MATVGTLHHVMTPRLNHQLSYNNNVVLTGFFIIYYMVN